MFTEQNGGLTLNWWPSTRLSGKTDIEDKIGELLKTSAETEPDTTIDHELLENLSQDRSEKKQTATSRDSFRKLWKTINDI